MTSHPHQQLIAAICDFCTTNPPVIAFDSHAFVQLLLRDDGALQLDTHVGDWAACTACAPLVQARSWNALAVRCVNQKLAAAGPVTASEDALRAAHRDLFRCLGKNLTGRTSPFARAA